MGRYLVESALALTPWVLALYVFYRLQSSGIWTADTPHRGKLSVLLLAAGMLLSFLAQSHFSKRRRK
ncbi:MAG: hypothetical protein FJ171_06675 [Gammaproteobacteria bacterium]|nr:hypothetical protein [Gammaproteobacteria bacterium]